MGSTLLVLLLSFLTVIVIRILKRSYSHRYFSIYQLIVSEEDPFNFFGLMIIMLPLFIGSILISALLGEGQLGLVIIYGLMTALLTIWPILLHACELLPPGAYKKRKSVYFIYFIFVIIYISLAFGGYSSYFTLINGINGRISIISNIFSLYDKLPGLIRGIFDNCLWILVVWIATALQKKIKNNIKEVPDKVDN